MVTIRKRTVIRLLLVVLLTTLVVACATKQQIHPGSINPTDSQSADSLVIYQAALTQAKTNVQSGTWPAAWSGDVDKAGLVYNTTLQAYLTWRDVYKGLKQGDAATLSAQFQADLTQLADLLRTLFARAGQKLPEVAQ